MSYQLSNVLSPFTAVLVLFVLTFILVAGFLVWYALRHSDEVRAKFGRGKMIFEIEAKKRRDAP